MELKVRLKYHRTQRKVFTSNARFKVVACGRRWGKTKGAIQWITKKVIGRSCQGKESLGWWVSPTYRQAKIAYRYFRALFGASGLVVHENKSELSFELLGGGRLEFRSAEIPDNLRGEGVDYLVVDECGTIVDAVWMEVLRPALMDSKGAAVLIGTPKGQNWFWEQWVKGQGADKEYRSWSFTTYDNPFLDKREVKQTEQELPDLVAQQEIYAQFLELGGMVFRNVDLLATSVPAPAEQGKVYQLGVDLAKYKDFTVLTVRCGARLVYFERFNKIDWELQEERIVNVSHLYNKARVVIDSTGVGDPIYERLAKRGLQIEPVQFTNATKQDLINNLVVKFDRREIEILNDPILKQELKIYAYEVTSRGRLRMNAPIGKHDDCVISLALCYWGATYTPSQTFITTGTDGRVRIVKSL